MQIKYFFILLVILYSCRTENQNRLDNNVIHLFNKNKPIEFDSINFVKLQTNKDFLIGDNVKFLLSNDEDIYIGNFNSSKQIFRFNRNGEFLNKIGNIGKAEGEYAQINDFIITGDTIEILSGNGTESIILKYLNTGEYISKIKINIGSFSFDRINNNYIFTTSYYRAYKSRIHISTLSGKLIESYIPNENSIVPITELNFAKCDSGVLFCETFNNKTYKYKDGEFKISYTFDFDKYRIPNEFYKNSFFKEFEKLNNNGFANIKSYFENSNIAVFVVLIQKANQPTVIHQVVHIKKTGVMLDNSTTENDKTKCLFNLVGITNNDELVYLQYPNEIIDRMQYFKTLPVNQMNKLTQTKLYDNPIIFYCKIKNLR